MVKMVLIDSFRINSLLFLKLLYFVRITDYCQIYKNIFVIPKHITSV